MTNKTEENNGALKMKQTGVSAGSSFAGEITQEKAKELGIGEWRLSAAASSEIEKIETSIRISELHSGWLLLS
jgi:hypothetical protein